MKQPAAGVKLTRSFMVFMAIFGYLEVVGFDVVCTEQEWLALSNSPFWGAPGW